MSTSVLKNTGYSSLNIYFEYLIGLVISIIIARSLGPSEYGIYSYLVKVAGISIIFTNAGINTGAIKFISEARALNRTQQIAPIFRYFQFMQRIKTLVIIVVVIALNVIWPGLIVDSEHSNLVFFVLFAIAFKSAHMYRVGVFKGHERFDLLAFSVLVVAPLNLLIVVGGRFFGADFTFYYMIFAGVACLYWGVSGIYLRRLAFISTPNIEPLDPALKTRIQHHLKIVTINTIIGGLVLGQCEVLLLNHLVDSKSVAFFTIGATIAGAALLLVPGVYSSVLFPIIARSVASVNDDPAKKIKESSRYLFVLSVLVAFPTLYYGQGVVALLYGANYSVAGLVLGVFVMVGISKSFSQPVSAYLMSIDKQTLLLKLSIFSLFFSLTMNYFCISNWGLLGAVMAYSIVSLVLMGVMMLFAYHYLSIVPDVKKSLIATLAAALALLIASNTSGSLMGLAELVVGYGLFGICYVFFLLMLNGLSKEDYRLILNLANRIHPRLFALLELGVNNRLKL